MEENDVLFGILAEKYWDETLSQHLTGIPEDAQASLKRQYIKDVLKSPEACAHLLQTFGSKLEADPRDAGQP